MDTESFLKVPRRKDGAGGLGSTLPTHSPDEQSERLRDYGLAGKSESPGVWRKVLLGC